MMRKSRFSIPLIITLLFTSLIIFNACEEEAGLSQEDLLNLELQYQKEKDSLAYLKYQDSLNYQRYLDSLDRLDQAVKDSLALYAGKGNVTYTVIIADGGIASNLNDARTAESARFPNGVEVTVSQFGLITTKTTDQTGMAIFENMVKGEVVGHAIVADFTPVTWTTDIVPCEECHIYYPYGARTSADTVFAGFFNIGNIIHIFPTTGANTSTLQGLVTIETDLTNEARELAPVGTEIAAVIDVAHPDFESRFVEVASDGTNTGQILSITYENAITTTTVQADGTYTFEVPAAAVGLPIKLNFADVAVNQILYSDVSGSDVTSETRRTIFSAAYTSANISDVPAAGAPTISFVAGGGATATAIVGSGSVISIQLLDGGMDYNGNPTVTIADPTAGTTATATATVSNGVVTAITVVNGGSGYDIANPPGVSFTEGSGADLEVASLYSSPSKGGVYSVLLNAGGSDYIDDPFVVFPTSPTGDTPVATSSLNGTGSVQQVTITDEGGGYASNPGVTITSGRLATAVARIDNGTAGAAGTATLNTADSAITFVPVLNAGSNYWLTPNVAIDDTNGTGAIVSATVVGGVITAFNVDAGGSGYTNPTFTITSANPGQLVRIDITEGGEYYSTTPIVTISDAGGGTGATADATITADAVSSISLTNAGDDNYSTATTVTITAVGSGATASTVWMGLGIESIDINASGQDYVNTPVLVFADPDFDGPGSVVATGTPILQDGRIIGVDITKSGQGYYTTPTIIVVTGSGASAEAEVSGSSVLAIDIDNGGSGYLAAPPVVIEGGGGSGATATTNLTNGIVTSITITSAGSGYVTTPTVTFLDPVGAEAEAVITDGVITAITVLKGGENYLAAPAVTISGGTGNGATATSTVTNGAVTAVTVTVGGTGYIRGNTPGAKEVAGVTPALDSRGTVNIEGNLTFIRDIHYGTGARQPQ